MSNLYWTGYYGFYDYVLNELMPDKTKDFTLFGEFLSHFKEIHMIYMFKDIVFISDFPKEINVNERGQLHNNNDAALLYRDTYSIHALNGVRMDKELATIKPEDLNKDLILKQPNADIRRELVRKLTPEQLVSTLDAKIIHESMGYELLGIDLGDNRIRPFLKMNNPSMPGVVHVEGVHPSCQTVEDALKFRNGLETFQPPMDLT